MLADGFIGGFGIDRIADILVEGVLTDDFSYLDEQVVDINGVVLTELVHLTDGNLDISLTQDGGNGGPHISGFIVSQAVDLCALVARCAGAEPVPPQASQQGAGHNFHH